MGRVAFDTRKLACCFEEAGMSQEQAEAVVEAEAGMLSDFILQYLATKSDLVEVKREIDELRAKVNAVRSGLKKESDDLRRELEQEATDLHSKAKSVPIQLKPEITELRAEIKSETYEILKWPLSSSRYPSVRPHPPGSTSKVARAASAFFRQMPGILDSSGNK